MLLSRKFLMETQTTTKVLARHNKYKRVDKETIETTREKADKNRGRTHKKNRGKSINIVLVKLLMIEVI